MRYPLVRTRVPVLHPLRHHGARVRSLRTPPGSTGMSASASRALLCALLYTAPSEAHEVPAAKSSQWLSSYYCGSEVCDEKTEEYCIVNKTHQYASYDDEAPLHCKFGSDKLKLWLTSSGSIKCSVPCLNPDAYWLVNDLDCGCSISLTFPMGVWLDPNAVIQAAVVNVTGRHSNPKARADRLIPCLLVRR